MTTNNAPKMNVTIGRLVLPNPVVVASGTFGSSDEYSHLVDYNGLGAIVTKSITYDARVGNKPPRVCETAAGMLNAIGLENKGVEHFIADTIPCFARVAARLIVSIAGNTIEDYERLAGRLASVERVDALEVNISCPNVKKGGTAFLKDAKQSRAVLRTVKKHCSKPVIVKISPEAYDVVDLARELVDEGCDGLSLINTIKGLAVDITKRTAKLGNITGGLSGPAIKPIALRYVYEVKKALQVPVIAGGGIMTAEDALEFIIVGADAVSLGTATFVNPRASSEVLAGITAYLVANTMKSVEELRGTLK